jgi:transposase InsO family protein
MIAAEGLPARDACRVLGVSSAGFYAWRVRAPSLRAIRHAWLTDLIREVPADSFGRYGARRVDAVLVLVRGVLVGHNAVALLIQRAGLRGITGARRARRGPDSVTAEDLVDRVFARSGCDELWVTDITEHPTREGKVYCAIVLDAFSRRVVGWSIDASPTTALSGYALGMAIDNRRPRPNATVIHSDHGVQLTSWAFTERAKRSGLIASMGSIDDCYDNAVIEAFWSRLQVELLNTKRWKTRIELANALFEYLEIYHNRQRRHSQLGMHTPNEYENLHRQLVVA